ncbi:FAD-linked oxidase-like protein [Acephala macrosclerotiorum]|nr:FAD-linked oxidase-like protein [Acephala macrosclerotiorum]
MADLEEPITFPIRYEDPEYQAAHSNLFSKSLTRPLEDVLPPGVNQADFDAAINKLKNVLGSEHVFIGKSLTEYIDPYELQEEPSRRKIPSGAVWMNKIVEVNQEFCYAVVEPGVTFTGLYDYCKLHKLHVWPSVPSLGWGSVVGNTVDRGTGFLPTATHHQHIAGLEILLADGDIVRTGQFGISDSPSAHLSKFTFGPSIEGLFLQSNLGIVTKMGIWLTPQPQAYLSCGFSMPEFEDVEVMVDLLGEMRRNGVLPNTVYVSNIVEWLGMVGKRVDYWDKDEPIPDWKVKELQEKLNMGYWNAKFGLYGPKGVIQAQIDEFKRVAAIKSPTGKLYAEMFEGEGDELLEATSVGEPHGGIFVGVPTLWSLPMVDYRLPKDGTGIAGHADYSPIMPSSGKTILEWARTSKRISEAQGWDLFLDFFMHERHVILVNFMTFDKSKPEHRRAISTILAQLYAEGKKRGYSTYRTHINYMDLNADSYDFNDHAYRRFVEKLKDAVDPDGMLSPGKQGMWPERYRSFRDPAGKNVDPNHGLEKLVTETSNAKLDIARENHLGVERWQAVPGLQCDATTPRPFPAIDPRINPDSLTSEPGLDLLRTLNTSTLYPKSSSRTRALEDNSGRAKWDSPADSNKILKKSPTLVRFARSDIVETPISRSGSSTDDRIEVPLIAAEEAHSKTPSVDDSTFTGITYSEVFPEFQVETEEEPPKCKHQTPSGHHTQDGISRDTNADWMNLLDPLVD